MTNTPQSMSEEVSQWASGAGWHWDASCKWFAIDLHEDGGGPLTTVLNEKAMTNLYQYSLTKQLEAYQHGLMTGTMPEAFGKPIAEDYIAAVKHQLGKDK